MKPNATDEQLARTAYLDLRDAVLYGCFGAPHDWRLIEECVPRGSGGANAPRSWKRWYCTRCRRFEETGA